MDSYALIADAAQTGGSSLVMLFTVFVLAVFVGFEIITKVPPTLHTPLMSGSNAVSGITVVGALVAAGQLGAGIDPHRDRAVRPRLYEFLPSGRAPIPIGVVP